MREIQEFLFSRLTRFFFTLTLLSAGPVLALDLDWSGQFRSEAHWIYRYTMGNPDFVDNARVDAGGYYIRGGGDNDASFQSLFLKLRPVVIVNDNIYIKSEWWVGDPVYGFFGSGVPYPAENRYFNGTFSRGSTITAQRVWAELLTDFGTVQVGRVPLQWGLGLVWDSGDGLFDRYASTGDAIRVVSRFGSFSVIPSIIKYSQGNNIGGACTEPDPATGLACAATTRGGGGVSDYSLTLRYENLDEDIELGLNFIRRLSGGGQDPESGYLGVNREASIAAYNTWDLYGSKRFGRFSVRGEVPITSGSVGQAEYQSYAVAVESRWEMSDRWLAALKVGSAPGNPNLELASSPSRQRAFYFHPNYKVGLIMFNYQLANFAGPNTLNDPSTNPANLSSPYDNPITNAKYLNPKLSYRLGRWNFQTNWVFAQAHESAAANRAFYNTWQRRYVTHAGGGVPNQGKSLGWEMDYGAEYQWDDAFRLGAEMGAFFPGDFYSFSNTGQFNATRPVFAAVTRLSLTF